MEYFKRIRITYSGTKKTQIKRKCLPKKMKTIFYLSYEKVEFRNNIDFNNNIS